MCRLITRSLITCLSSSEKISTSAANPPGLARSKASPAKAGKIREVFLFNSGGLSKPEIMGIRNRIVTREISHPVAQEILLNPKGRTGSLAPREQLPPALHDVVHDRNTANFMVILPDHAKAVTLEEGTRCGGDFGEEPNQVGTAGLFEDPLHNG